MSYLCFGTFFTLLCGNKKDWDKLRKPKIPNRVLYAALLDIVDKQKKPTFHVDAAKSSDKDYIASDAKLCKRDDHPIQRSGAVTKYLSRFEGKLRLWPVILNATISVFLIIQVSHALH